MIAFVRERHSRWVFLLPALHICACVVSFIGLVIPSLQYVGILFTFIVVADLPISLPFYALAWKYGALAVIWIFVAGTFWWYLLSRGAKALLSRFIPRDQSRSGKRRNRPWVLGRTCPLSRPTDLRCEVLQSKGLPTRSREYVHSPDTGKQAIARVLSKLFVSRELI